jgi:membrane protease YdiL (CAAX protease family)
MNDQTLRRAASLLEVLGVYLAGPLAMYYLRHLFEISITNPLTNLTAQATNAELVRAAREMFVLLLFQYAGYFMLAIPLNWWYRRRGASAYGLTKAGIPWKRLFVAGIATAALWELPVLLLSLVDLIHPSPTAPWRQAFVEMSWRRWQFWLFSAVCSWAVIPFFEELFYRGYCQRRLAEDWGDGAAILGAACLFTFTHAQYFRPNAYSIGMIVGLLLSAIGFGVVFAWTRSLIPAVIAHALFDIPTTAFWQSVLLITLFVVAIVLWRRGLTILRQVFSDGRLATMLLLGAIGTLYAVLGTRDSLFTYFASAGMFVIAVGLEIWDRVTRQAESPGVA